MTYHRSLPLTQGSESIEAEESAYYHIKKTIQDVQNLSRYHGKHVVTSRQVLILQLMPESECWLQVSELP